MSTRELSLMENLGIAVNFVFLKTLSIKGNRNKLKWNGIHALSRLTFHDFWRLKVKLALMETIHFEARFILGSANVEMTTYVRPASLINFSPSLSFLQFFSVNDFLLNFCPKPFPRRNNKLFTILDFRDK